ncbi:hypothetical protein HID58_069800, partial [Brassica napus]
MTGLSPERGCPERGCEFMCFILCFCELVFHKFPHTYRRNVLYGGRDGEKIRFGTKLERTQ